VPLLVRSLARIAGIADVAMTTNGLLLTRYLEELIEAGLDRVNISLDTLRPERFRQMTRRERLGDVLAAIDAAAASALESVKVNVVLLRGFNDDEIEDFGAYARATGLTVRFIEFMPLEAGDVWSRSSMVPGREVYERLHAWRPLRPLDRGHAAETAERFRFVSGNGEIGIISPVTRAFCGACNRARVTAEGSLRTCLFSMEEVDLKSVLRSGAGDREIEERIRRAWRAKEPGHLVNTPGYRRPDRTMSAIGG
jgi:cyclic pyranopterin phosphate synthase